MPALPLNKGEATYLTGTVWAVANTEHSGQGAAAAPTQSAQPAGGAPPDALFAASFQHPFAALHVQGCWTSARCCWLPRAPLSPGARLGPEAHQIKARQDTSSSRTPRVAHSI